VSRRFSIVCCCFLILLTLAPPALARVVWRRSLEPWSLLRSKRINSEKAPPYIEGARIYAVSSRGRYLELDALSGKRLVKARIKYRASSGLLVEEGRVYFGSQSGDLVCLDSDNGEVLWTYPLKVIDISPPAVFGDLLIFQTGIDEVTAINKASGEWVWTYQHPSLNDISIMGISAPMVDKQFVYIGTADGYLLALHGEDGRLVWKKQVFTQGNFRDIDGGLAQDETTIFACDFYGEVVAVSKKTGEKYWSYQVGGLAGPVVEGELVYVAGRDGSVVALDKNTGLKLWDTVIFEPETFTPMKRLLTPTLYKQWLIVPNLQGKIFFLDPTTGQVEKTIHLFKSISVPIQAGDDGMYLFSNKGFLYKLRY
jgi:outer membrane protein assembly factor BamB